jgi:nicotinate-nucleotide adenylyltransferase
MKIAIFGGTFNPIHLGHLFLAEEVRCGLGFDRIIFVPAFQPAHKEVAGGAAAADRLAMCREAVAGSPHFTADDCEIRRGGVSYMIDTLQDIAGRYAPKGKPAIIIGDDLVRTFPHWKRADEIVRRARLLVVHRRERGRVDVAFPHEYLDNKVLPLSSSEIRGRLRDGRAVRFLIPESVYAYIEAKRLYRF